MSVESRERSLSLQSKSPSEAADSQHYVTFGLIISVRYGDVERIRSFVEENGGKIVFQTVASGPLYLLREYQVQKALQGDTSQLREVHERKSKDRRVEK